MNILMHRDSPDDSIKVEGAGGKVVDTRITRISHFFDTFTFT